MTTWTEFVAGAPTISDVFRRRHSATGNLCLLGTLRADGFPRISPMEPRIFEGELWLGGMPGTRKFADLQRDPRFTLHTATVDTQVSDGDAKIWGTARDVQDRDLHQRFAEALYAEIGLDLRGQEFGYFPAADVLGASCVQIVDGHLDITVWRAGGAEEVVRKH
ncbi:pyridoxamine 5'-phosphate oxidase family protein [Pseudonocardia sp. C8]|uniref:pyridoxamine 5'-phosphate oxidase family protein n=1 Tax=Pseudonocardia sp. C8 TaxID=2762759 RepID=UPI0016424B24|nr:pyridoxamine 5'-phosphate oxidase family protein [Pseudonocardia sp. C8]MBC3192847.1 pyridoxamine 5'-phosphate oxidase family protein [Pseudonocardia sp. C8]